MSDFTLVQLLNQKTPVIITGGYVPRGAYDNATDYAVGDSVDYLSSSYVMYVDAAAGTLPTDTTKWQIIANKGATGSQGIQGETGETGTAATATAGTTTTGAAGSDASVVNSGTTAAAVFDFTIPRGDTGATGSAGADGADGADGAAATIAVGTVTTVDPSDPATVTNSGTSAVAVFDFEIPKGDPGTSGHVIKDEGTPLTARAGLNFVGAGVTATDDAGNDQTIVTIPSTDITGKASLALDNLASVAINTSLISDTDSTDDLGSTTKQWANVHTDRLVSTISDLVIENDLSDGDITFKVNDGGVDTTVMTLDGATGNVGIGTTTPQALFDVTSNYAKTETSSNVYSYFGKTNEAANYAALQMWMTGGAAAVNRVWALQTIEQGVANAGSLVFQPNGGNVGIGTTSPTSKLHNAGSISLPYVAKTADYTLTDADYTVAVTASSVNITILLPAAAGCVGRIYNIKKMDATAYTVIVDGNASEVIDGDTTQILSSQYDSLQVQSTGSAWLII